MMFKGKFLIAVISVLVMGSTTLFAQSSPAPSAPPCVFADDAPIDVQFCLLFACWEMQKAWNDCETSACRANVQTTYAANVIGCALETPVMNDLMFPIQYRIFDTLNDLNGDWIIFRYDGKSITYEIQDIM